MDRALQGKNAAIPKPKDGVNQKKKQRMVVDNNNVEHCGMTSLLRVIISIVKINILEISLVIKPIKVLV